MNFVDDHFGDSDLIESALEQLFQCKAGYGPWIDEERRKTLGWYVRLLEEVLTKVNPNESLANTAWEEWDDLLRDRADYVVWRRLGTPSFWRRGKTRKLEFYRPRKTTWYYRNASAPPALNDIVPSRSAIRSEPWTIKLGIVGALVDRLYQDNREAQRERRRRRDAAVVELAPEISTTSGPNSPEITSILWEYVEEVRTKGIVGSSEATLFLSFVGCGFVFSDAEAKYVVRELLPPILAALREIDPTYDIYADHNAMPYLNDYRPYYRDQTGLRFIPANWEDQLIMLCDALERIAGIAKWLLRDQSLSDDQKITYLRMRSALMVASARLLRVWRIRCEKRAETEAWQGAQQTVVFLKTKELHAFEAAAIAASDSDLSFLAARLWQTFHWYDEAWSDKKSPLDLSYRIVAEAGLRMNPKTRTPKPGEFQAGTAAQLGTGASS